MPWACTSTNLRRYCPPPHPCSGPSCSGPYWRYSPWSACNATYGGGTASRSATCEAPEGQACTAGSKQATQRECNTAPCEAYAWRVGAWGACTATCGGAFRWQEGAGLGETYGWPDTQHEASRPGHLPAHSPLLAPLSGLWLHLPAGGVRSREVICVDAAGDVAPAGKCVPDTQPPGNQQCGLEPCDFCAANDCFGHGYCQDGACVCSPGAGFTGAYCQARCDGRCRASWRAA